MKKILWTQPSGSGLCDRLLDLMLMSAYAKVFDFDLHLEWIEGASKDLNNWKKTEYEIATWEQVRYKDFRYEIFSQYFTLPDNIKINDLGYSFDIYFNKYLGGVYSPINFHNNFLKDTISYEDFLIIFKQTLKQFNPKEKLLDLVKDLPKPDVSLHLRRGDKIRVDIDSGSISIQELDNLNNLTLHIANKLISNDTFVYIASDDKEEKRYYETIFNSIKYGECLEYEKTYIDMYMLSVSKWIILSQKHSNFSLFNSLINEAKLIYLYSNCIITENNFNLLDNIIYYKNIDLLNAEN